jgi:CNT family concentrative nucleoside transporter
MLRVERIISACGLVVMVAVAWSLSAHKRRIPWRVVGGGLLLQVALALAVLRTVAGQRFFAAVGDFFTGLLRCVDEGAAFVFGDGFGEHFVAFQVLPTIIFFSSLMAILYHLGIVQRIVVAMAWWMQYTLGTSGAESLATAANVFVGPTEAPLVVRPYVPTMTQSELMATMVGGFATIAGGVFAAYVGMGIDAGHLLTASVISAPAALLVAKVMQPEVEDSPTRGRVRIQPPRVGTNVVEAAANGALDGLKLALNVGAMLIAFVALVAMLNGLIGWVGLWFDYADEQAWTLQKGFGYVFYPFAWVMGIPRQDCFLAGQLLGTKMVLNEFLAYEQLGTIMEADAALLASGAGGPRQLTDRGVVILTYALCGFANFGTIGIQLGGIGGMAPERKADLARLSLRAMIGGTLAAFMTGCIAGMLL